MTISAKGTALSGMLSHLGSWPVTGWAWALALAIPCVSVALSAAQEAPEPEPYIRHIYYERTPIFSESDQERLSWAPLGWVNALHVDTRQSTIQRRMLLSEGDRLDPVLLAESERKLRATGHLVEVSIETEHVSPDSVDLFVHTREVWTTTFDIRFESFESTTLLSFRLAEKNFLGSGRQISIARDEQIDRTIWSLGGRDPYFIDGYWDVGASYSNATDGTAYAWNFNRPFFQLASEWAWTSEYVHAGASPRYYLGGQYYVRPHGDFTEALAELQRRVGTWGEGVIRVGLGLRLEDQFFDPKNGLPVYDSEGGTDLTANISEYPEDRDVRGPIASVERQPTSFAQRRFVDKMGQQEDIHVGHKLRLAVGWITRALGSSSSGFWFFGQDEWHLAFSRNVVRTTLFTEGHWDSGSGRDPNMKLGVQVRGNRYYSEAWSLAGSILAATGSHIDRNRVYTLGIDNGLRSALPLEYPGDRFLRANFEARWVYPPGLIGLVTPGITGFADFGTAFFADERDLTLSDIRGALGIGLRFGMNRSALNAPVRVDFAWPVFYSTNRAAPVISIGIGQVF